MQITVNGTKIGSSVSDIKTKYELIDSLITKFEGVLDDIPTCWSGTDSKSYVTFMQENCIKKLKNMNEIIKKYTEYLDKVPGVYERLDEVFSNKNISV